MNSSEYNKNKRTASVIGEIHSGCWFGGRGECSCETMRQFLLGLGCRLGTFSDRMFGQHLLLTNVAVSTAMALAGDGVQQYYEVACSFQDKLHIKRTMHMGAAGFTTGIVTHYWYNFLDRWWQSRAAKVVLKKVLYDQILFSPICLTIYFGTLAILDGSNYDKFKHELTDKGSTVYTVEWLIWPLAQTFNFYYLPLRYRVVFDTVISFGFDVFTPYIIYRDQRKFSRQIVYKNVSETGIQKEPSKISQQC
ncbi:mpv17-like protein 2 isoform X3 [Varroa destructor]|uniref:Mpv17-like protein 2 n=2 Tax=Varroa destructor TaxID=109461 RepID=A0A7M7MCU2_VARDE|nr:mpv17-like protein 2 isoform X3 [Varroa destructor]XP_022652677.1 mpv17-like protein 2 isoform X3 [Varroa destructor]